MICDDQILKAKLASFHTRFLCIAGSYSLSIRDLDQDNGEVVKNYRIRNMDNGGYYITAKISFNSLKELVQHHSRVYTAYWGDWLALLFTVGVSIWLISVSSLSRPHRRFGWLVHKTGEAVPVEGTAEALVAGWVGDPPRVPQTATQAWSRTVWRSLDGWVREEGGSFMGYVKEQEDKDKCR